MTSNPGEEPPIDPFFSEKNPATSADGYNKLHIPANEVPDSAAGFDKMVESLGLGCPGPERAAILQAGEFVRWSARKAGIPEVYAIDHRLNRSGGLTLVFKSNEQGGTNSHG
jgi:hypothetical protein